MNDPRYEALEERVRKLEAQNTEPIRIDRLEIDRGGTQDLLKETNRKLEQIIQTQADRSEKFDKLELAQQELKQSHERLERDQKAQFDALAQRIVDEAVETREVVEKRFEAVAETMNLILSRLPEKGE